MNNITTISAHSCTSTEGSVSIEIYVDGCCTGNARHSGWGVTLRRNEGGIKTKYRPSAGSFGHDVTNQQTDMRAVIQALRCLRKDEVAPIMICTDSQLITKGFTEWMPGWTSNNWKKSDGNPVVNQDLWKELIELTKERNITWEWVSDDAGNPKKKEVNRIAKAAAKEEQVKQSKV
jgi:ribonuclease HI